MPNVEFKVKGLSQMQRAIRTLAGRTPDDISQAMFAEMKVEKEEVLRRTPKDTGALRESVIIKLYFTGRDHVYSIFAGGSKAFYALFVHENLEAHHPVGQAKFIESVVRESAPYFTQRVARRLRERFRGRL